VRSAGADGADWFGVTSVEEGVALRQVCPAARILIMSEFLRRSGDGDQGESDAVVWEAQHLTGWRRRRELGRAPGGSGTSRDRYRDVAAGRAAGGLGSTMERFARESPLRLEALMTHFHSPGDAEMTAGQVRQFVTVADTIAAAGMRPEMLSAGSSAGR